MPQCQTHPDAGSRCRMPARHGSDHCVNHDPGYAEQQQANSVAGGRASGDTRRKLAPIDLSFVSLTDRASIQALLDAVLRLELLGRLPQSRARTIVRILSLAIRNFDHPARSGFYDALTAAQAPTYATTRTQLDAALEDIWLTLRDAELEQEMRALSRASSRRQQRYKDEDAFDRGPAAKLPTRTHFPTFPAFNGNDDDD